LAISLWHQSSKHHQDQIAVAAPTREQVVIASAGDSPQISQPAIPSFTHLPGMRPVVSSESSDIPQSFSEVEVPAFVVLDPTTDQSGLHATLRNASARSLEISVTASSSRGGPRASAQVTLAPFEEKSLSEEDLLVKPGELLTLHSPPFRDRETQGD
jgi:hypothetical protein